MAPETTIDDTLLSAWLDGELEGQPDLAARVQAWVQEHPEAAARVAQWRADGAALREHWAPLLAEPVPAPLQTLVMQPQRSPRWALAAAAVAIFAVGGVVGALVGASSRSPATVAAGTSSAGWVQRAAYAHGVYTAEPRHPVEVRAQEEHLARWLTARIKVPVKLFNLQDQGFELVGGRLLPDGSGKSAQLMYQDAQGVRVTVYLRRPEEGTDAAFKYERQGELGLFYWVEEGAGYALVGALPRERLLALAEAIYRQKPEMPPAASRPGT